MAVETARVCDFGQGSCKQPASAYRVWRDGDRQALAIDLCEQHAGPLLAAVEGAQQVDLPAKPRERMTVTPLRTTSRTARLKKR